MGTLNLAHYTSVCVCVCVAEVLWCAQLHGLVQVSSILAAELAALLCTTRVLH